MTAAIGMQLHGLEVVFVENVYDPDPADEQYETKSLIDMKLVEIFNGNPFQAQMVKNLLENEGVESFLKDEIMARSPIFRPEGGVRVMISDLDYEKAKLVVDEYERSQRE